MATISQEAFAWKFTTKAPEHEQFPLAQTLVEITRTFIITSIFDRSFEELFPWIEKFVGFQKLTCPDFLLSDLSRLSLKHDFCEKV